MTPREAIPVSWIDALDQSGEIAMGFDPATTEKQTSNPSSLSVVQRVLPVCRVVLLVSWKTSDDRVSKAMLRRALDDLLAARRKARRLCVDASSEKFFAAQVRREFGAYVPVELVVSNEKKTYRGQGLDAKTLLGNLYTSALEDGLIELPPGDWIKEDHRLVTREKGGFVYNLGKDGQHCDTFVSTELAYWGLCSSSGPVEASAAQVGSFGHARRDDDSLPPILRNTRDRSKEQRYA